MKAFIPSLIISILVFSSCTNIESDKAQIESEIPTNNTPQLSDKNEADTKLDLEPEYIDGDGYYVMLDSTQRIADEPFEYNPLTQSEVSKLAGDYQVLLSSAPECSGTRVINRYVHTLENKEPYDHAMIFIEHLALDENLETAKRALITDEICGYIDQNEENKEAIEELLENYREVYMEADLAKIKEIISTL